MEFLSRDGVDAITRHRASHAYLEVAFGVRRMNITKLIKRLRTDDPESFRLASVDPADTGGIDLDKDQANGIDIGKNSFHVVGLDRYGANACDVGSQSTGVRSARVQGATSRCRHQTSRAVAEMPLR